LRGKEMALRWIKSAIPDVTEINLAQEGVRFAHPAKYPDGREPQHDSSNDAPPFHNSENEHSRQNRKNEYELPVGTEQKVGAIR
jgi:hypothetical protein